MVKTVLGKLLWGLLLVMLVFVGFSTALAQDEGSAVTVSAENLPQAIADAKPGDAIEVTGGIFTGHLDIDKPVTLIGIDWPVIDGENYGTVVNLTAPGITMRGFIIRNSGQVLDQENSGIAIQAADITIENNRFENTLFGVYAKNGHNAVIRNNVITSKDLDLPRRGDPIRIWYSQDVLIEGNEITKGRDVVLWYSERVTVRDNEVSDGRYGLHFMYCDDATIEYNTLLDNSVGAFFMYSRRVTVQHNTIAGNRGPSGYGVGMKDMDDAIIRENIFLDNRVGVHLDTSPREVDSFGRYDGNVFAYNDIGVGMMPSVRRNEFSNNSFVDNEEQVAVGGGGQLKGNIWSVNGQGNYWSDYAGYDADDDGTGDLVYKSDRLFENLMQREPSLRLFLYSPATNAIDFSAKAFPIVRPQPKVEDEFPLMTPQIPTEAPQMPQATGETWFIFAVVFTAMALALVLLPRLTRKRYIFPQPETQA